MGKRSSRVERARLRRLAAAEKETQEALEARTAEISTHRPFSPKYMADWLYAQDTGKKDFDSLAELVFDYRKEGKKDIIFVKLDQQVSHEKAFAYHSNKVQLPLQGWQQQEFTDTRKDIRQSIGKYGLVRIIETDTKLELYTRDRPT